MMIPFGYVVGKQGGNFVLNLQQSYNNSVASTFVLVNLYFPRDFPVYLQHI
jgi:hypothetical protein